MSTELFTGTVDTGHGKIDYFKFGTGRQPFVIIPGLGVTSVIPSGPAVAAAYEVFSDDCTVYLFERIDQMTAGYTIRDMARDEAEAMQSLGIENADVLGCSMGGMIAIYLAAGYPELVRKLVISSSLARQNRTSRAVLGRWYELAEKGDVVALNRAISAKVYSRMYFEKFKDAFKATEHNGTSRELSHFATQVGAALHFDAWEELEKIRAKVMVTGSWNDNVLGARASVEMAAKLKCPLHMHAGYGHACYDEAPDFKNRLYAFYYMEKD